MHYSLHFNSKKTRSREYETSLLRKSKATPELDPAPMYLGFHNPLKLHPETN
ncbi:hypothetical protein OIU74_007486 [Salix koriyanagi]|uniref:Uncharacterized protein n=1 Tax=Salix koriyanagi TaxID=2511006 RepID=A0A9Q0Z6C1_9ROSI|nr:hypothetical protein OIU74_007486 [Salix koriyanagi]